MATKKQVDPLQGQYKTLVALNKRLRYLSDVYYIGYDNRIYMHSLVDFIEKVIILDDDFEISAYKGVMYLPNQLFDFTKDAKITKLTATETQQAIVLGQMENELSVRLNKIYVPNDEIRESDILVGNVIPQMYSKMHLQFIDKLISSDFIRIPDKYVEDMLDNKVVNFIEEDECMLLSMSRNIFPSIKKDDIISYTVLPLVDEINDKKKYVLYKKKTDGMTIYTLSAYLVI